MRQLLDADLELVIETGFAYLPLLFDPSVEREISSPVKAGILLKVGARHFVKSFALQSLVENYAAIDPQGYAQLRTAVLQKYLPNPAPTAILPDANLRTILFSVMPYFLRRNTRAGRRRLHEEEILDLISEKINLPVASQHAAARLVELASCEAGLPDLGGPAPSLDLPRSGPISATRLREWIFRALERRIVQGERHRLRQLLAEQQAFDGPQHKYLAILLYLAEKGSLELDGFGFSRIASGHEYLIYKHTGEYALKDFYGRLYLFPDCRVAVSTIPPLRPIVMDTYKHPFLEGHEAGQAICLRDFNPARVVEAAGVIKALEEGINALLYGYSSRRRNGYHSLDPVSRPTQIRDLDQKGSADLVSDPLMPGRYMWPQDFEDYRVPTDYPRLATGQVPVTNDHTP